MCTQPKHVKGNLLDLAFIMEAVSFPFKTKDLRLYVRASIHSNYLKIVFVYRENLEKTIKMGMLQLPYLFWSLNTRNATILPNTLCRIVVYQIHNKMKKKKTLSLLYHNSLYTHHVLHATSPIITSSLLPEISIRS
jgi:hypothetical protein